MTIAVRDTSSPDTSAPGLSAGRVAARSSTAQDGTPARAAADIDVPDLVAMAEYLLARLGMAPEAELSLSIVGPREMAELHEEWLEESGPTDVLSFPMDELVEPAPGEPSPAGVLGDVVLCPEVAARQAESAGHSPQHEMRVLLTHGVLHLLGHDHALAQEAAAMFGRQADLVADYLSGA